MHYRGIDEFLERGRRALAKGPVALIFVEDEIEIETSLRHHVEKGFRSVVMLAPDEIAVPAALAGTVHRVVCDVHADGAVPAAVNRIAAAAPGVWFYYGFNAEYLFYPFCEHRTVGEMLAFHAEERRDAMLAYVVDVYATDLDRHPNAVSLIDACLDRSGYYALARPDPENHNHPRERQLDFFGGLRWRFEEHIPPERRRIDRIALFRAQKGVELRPDFTFSDDEYNTYACPWHHNLTAAVLSFRTAKALRTNPGSKYDVRRLGWHNTVPCDWHSQQLMDLGLMEPGQWF